MPVCERCKQPTPKFRPNRFTCYGCGRKICYLCCGKDFGTYWCDDYNGKIADDCKEHAIQTVYKPKGKHASPQDPE